MTRPADAWETAPAEIRALVQRLVIYMPATVRALARLREIHFTEDCRCPRCLLLPEDARPHARRTG
jgi:hypothetical protein